MYRPTFRYKLINYFTMFDFRSNVLGVKRDFKQWVFKLVKYRFFIMVIIRIIQLYIFLLYFFIKSTQSESIKFWNRCTYEY